MKKNKITEKELINWWLDKYHNTNMDEVKASHPEWMKDPSAHSRDFYQEYAVTQEQHDEWNEWAKETLRKSTGYSKKYIDKAWPWVYLNVSPSVKKEE